ncbi:MAG: glycosyltransferase [Aureliella sp.]
MRIAYLVNHYPTVSHSFIRREILALEQLGVEVHRFSIRPAGPCPDPADQNEADKTRVLLSEPIGLLIDLVATLCVRPVKLWKSIFQMWRLGSKADRGRIAHFGYLLEACRLSRLLSQADIKHIHAHFGTNPPAVALLCSVLGDVTFSFTVHGPEEFDRPLTLKLREKISAASFVVAISSFGRSQLMRWCDQSDWHKIVVVRCGVDAAYLDATPQISPAPNTMVCVGRLCEQKGQLLLLDAMRELLNRGVEARLTLAGDGDMRTVIEARMQELELTDTVTITGWLSGDEVKSSLLQSSVMILPSFAEGLPVVIMEALALERPVISTYVAGIPELVEEGQSGWLVPAGSTELLADSMQNALATPMEQLQAMGKAGKAAVAERHCSISEAQFLKSCFEQFTSL